MKNVNEYIASHLSLKKMRELRNWQIYSSQDAKRGVIYPVGTYVAMGFLNVREGVMKKLNHE